MRKCHRQSFRQCSHRIAVLGFTGQRDNVEASDGEKNAEKPPTGASLYKPDSTRVAIAARVVEDLPFVWLEHDALRDSRAIVAVVVQRIVWHCLEKKVFGATNRTFFRSQ